MLPVRTLQDSVAFWSKKYAFWWVQMEKLEGTEQVWLAREQAASSWARLTVAKWRLRVALQALRDVEAVGCVELG